MAVIVGSVKRNLDTSPSADTIRTVLHTVGGAEQATQVIAIANADAAKTGQVLDIDIDNRARVANRDTEASTVNVNSVVATATATLIMTANANRLNVTLFIDGGQPVSYGYTNNAVNIGPYYNTDEKIIAMWRGDIWVMRHTSATTDSNAIAIELVE